LFIQTLQTTIILAILDKYLGYFVNRTLKSNFHICNFLKEKADKQLNYMIRVLEEHGDFNLLVCTSSIILFLVFVPNIEFREA
jgi:hypothetical protein